MIDSPCSANSSDPAAQFYPPRKRINLADFGVGLFLFIFLPALAFGLTAVFFEKTETLPSDASFVSTGPMSTLSDSAEDLPTSNATDSSDSPSGTSDHAVVQLIRQDKSVWTIFLLFFMTCILAPINEELLFRGTFQQSLENAVFFQNESRFPASCAGWLTIIIPAILFSAIHLRVGNSNIDVQQLSIQLKCGALGHAFFAPLFLGWLQWVHGLRLVDVLGPISCWRSQIQSGFLVFVLLLAPVYAVQTVVTGILAYFQCGICADPFSLLVLALGMGWLYYRYQTLLASITLHLLFNATGLLAAYWLI